ncbi:MAG: Eco57I restriction-modification methylase domain-containing protein [Acidimicrobiales bacterium]
MLNISVAGTLVSTYYLAAPDLFLRDQKGRLGEGDRVDGIGAARRALRRLVAEVDEETPLPATRRAVLAFLAALGWTGIDAVPEGVPADGVGRGPDGVDHAWLVFAPGGQHLDAAPSGRRAGLGRPQRRAEMCVREGVLGAAFLANGSELRVVRRDPGLGGEASYLSVGLPGLHELGDDHEWRVVWALLRPDAFAPDDDGQCLWDRVEVASQDTAAKVSEDLSAGVRVAIEALARGALAWMRRADPAAVEPSARALFADALRVAYRILFAAFAEDRGLLPVAVPSYDAGYSLARLRRLISDPATVWSPDEGYLWAALRSQWRMLRDGVSAGELRVGAFNGELFDISRCPLLDDDDMVIGDRFVATALDALAFTQPVTGRRSAVARRRVNYRELGVEQLGSIYEGLLAFEPRIPTEETVFATVGKGAKRVTQHVAAAEVDDEAEVLERYPPGSFYLFEASGQRKGSGSYYTPRALAHFVVREALEPLVRDATSEAILSLRVCDPAMGSGAFLVPAVHFLTEAYGEALIREGVDLDRRLDDEERASYRRLVVERCIFGVDVSPMAVELAKVSLWLATAAAGKPLTFLDANLRCGDALVGADLVTSSTTPPPARAGRRDVGEAAAMLPLFERQPAVALRDVLRGRLDLAAGPSDERTQVQAKARRWAALLADPEWARLRALGDWWVAPFYVPALRRAGGRWSAVRDRISREGAEGAPPEARDIRHEVNPFHWELEFPEVFFTAEGERRPDAGFDVIVGNPPWEGVTFKAAEFYGRFDPTYAFLRTKEDKAARQAELDRRVDVKEARVAADSRVESLKAFIKTSGVYRMLGVKGTFNLYRAFLERELALLSPRGRLGLTIDAGLVGDAGTQYHRRELLDACVIDRFVLVDNVNGIFPIHRSEQFVLLVAGRGGCTDPLPFSVGVDRLEHLNDLQRRTVPIKRAVIDALAPETTAIPDVRDPSVLELLGAIYADHPLLLDSDRKRWRCWYHLEFRMDDHRDCFATDAMGRPMLEGKHHHQFTAGFAPLTYRLNGFGEEALLRWEWKRSGHRGPVSMSMGLPCVSGEARLNSPGVRTGVLEVPADQYRLVIRDIARATDERTLIACVLSPGDALGHSAAFFHRSVCDDPVVGYRTILDARAMVFLAGVLNSLVLDFVARRKVTAHLTKSILATLPVPETDLETGLGAEVVALSGRLTCRSPAFEDLAGVLGVSCAPLDHRTETGLRADLDAAIAHLYGLSADHLELVLADFRRSEATESSPVRPDEAYKELVRAAFLARSRTT